MKLDNLENGFPAVGPECIVPCVEVGGSRWVAREAEPAGAEPLQTKADLRAWKIFFFLVQMCPRAAVIYFIIFF